MKKVGPNDDDKKRIKNLCLEGATPAEISETLLIEESAVVVCIESLEGVEVNEAPAVTEQTDDSPSDPQPESGENAGSPAPTGENGSGDDSFVQ